MLTPNSVVGTVDCKLESTPFLMLVIHTGSSWWAQTCEITLDSMMNSVGNRDKSAASTSVWSFPSILTLSNWKTFLYFCFAVFFFCFDSLFIILSCAKKLFYAPEEKTDKMIKLEFSLVIECLKKNCLGESFSFGWYLSRHSRMCKLVLRQSQNFRWCIDMSDNSVCWEYRPVPPKGPKQELRMERKF